MKHLLLLGLVATVPWNAFAAKKKVLSETCEEVLKPDRKVLTAGSTLRFKDTLKGVALTRSGTVGAIVVSELRAYQSFDLSLPSYPIRPGDIVRTLSSYKKDDGVAFIEVTIDGVEDKLFMHWIDVYRNAEIFELARETQAKVPSLSARLKFPDKMRQAEFESLADDGKTWYGRPFAKVGDRVWIANHSRAFSKNSVGIVREITNPLTPKSWTHRGLASVETLSGDTKQVYHYDCNPLSDEEWQLVAEE